MAKQIFKGNSPKNARIKINYEGVKPTVRFSYPCKKRQSQSTMLSVIFICWLIFIMIVGVIHGIYLNVTEQASQLDMNCTQVIDDFVKNNLTSIKEQVCSERNVFEEFNYGLETEIKQNLYFIHSKAGILQTFLFCLWLFLPPLLIYFPFRKSWHNVYPKYQAFLASKKIRKFRSKDVEHDDKLGYYCEIPVFHNVVLNYEATKEFSKYLREFEIREHNFRLYKPRKSPEKRRWRKYKPPKTFNEYIWYARFYFSQKPLTGKLDVIFR